MYTSQTIATSNRAQNNRPTDVSQRVIDLQQLVAQIKTEETWYSSDRNVTTVFKSKDLCMVLIALHKGAQLTPHIAESMLCIQVLEGTIDFDTDCCRTELGAGQTVTLKEGNSYNVRAPHEAVFLLMMDGDRHRVF